MIPFNRYIKLKFRRVYMKKIVLLSVVGMAIVWAQGMGQGGMKGQKEFHMIDSNNDGKITEEEFTKFRVAKMAKKASEGKMMKNAAQAPKFSDIDTNGDNSVSPEELMTFHKSHKMGKSKGGC